MNKPLTEQQCYGAMMQALPCHAVILLAMPELEILKRMSKVIGRVPPKNEKSLNNWVAKSINKKVSDSSQLADLGELAALDGIGRKLKKLAKKVVAPIKKITVNPIKKVFKKLEDSKTVKKIARPLAYAAGAIFGGAAGLQAVKQVDETRNAMVANKNQEKINRQVYEAQQAQINEALAPQPMPDNSQQPTIQTQVNYPNQPSYSGSGYSQSLMPQQAQYGSVQRFEQEEPQQKVVGLNTQAIIDNIKKNPIPWAIGGFGVLYLITRNNQPRQQGVIA